MRAATPSRQPPSWRRSTATLACACGTKSFPNTGWPAHKGYSTPEHCQAIQEFGITPLHRLSFEPVRARSLYPVDYDPQMGLFDTAGAA